MLETRAKILPKKAYHLPAHLEAVSKIALQDAYQRRLALALAGDGDTRRGVFNNATMDLGMLVVVFSFTPRAIWTREEVESIFAATSLI